MIIFRRRSTTRSIADVVPTIGLRAMRKRARLISAITLGVAGVVYLVVAIAYGISLGRQEIPELQAPRNGVAVTVVQTSINAQSPLSEALVVVQPSKTLLDGQGRLVRDVRITLRPTLDAEALDFPVGSIPEARAIKIPLRGRVQNYPFDTYSDTITIAATLVDEQVDVDQGRRMPVVAGLSMREAGWALDVQEKQSDSYYVTFDQKIVRAGSTITIAILMLLLMIAVAMLASWTARSVLAGALEPQVAVASWMAALLFALIPIRNFLPGAPPVGSWIDILVFFWVLVAVMIAMVTIVITLLMRARREDDDAIALQEAASGAADDVPGPAATVTATTTTVTRVESDEASGALDREENQAVSGTDSTSSSADSP